MKIIKAKAAEKQERSLMQYNASIKSTLRYNSVLAQNLTDILLSYRNE